MKTRIRGFNESVFTKGKSQVVKYYIEYRKWYHFSWKHLMPTFMCISEDSVAPHPFIFTDYEEATRFMNTLTEKHLNELVRIEKNKGVHMLNSVMKSGRYYRDRK